MAQVTGAFEQLVSAIQLLAADPRSQIAAFPEFVSAADEIALMLHDALILVEQDHTVAESALAAVRALDTALADLSSPQEDRFWSAEGLASDLRWQRLRGQALDVLKVLGAPRIVPQLRSEYAKATNSQAKRKRRE